MIDSEFNPVLHAMHEGLEIHCKCPFPALRKYNRARKGERRWARIVSGIQRFLAWLP